MKSKFKKLSVGALSIVLIAACATNNEDLIAPTGTNTALDEIIITASKVSASRHAAERVYSVPPVGLSAPQQDRSEYPVYDESPIKLTSEEPVSTFSVDVDTSSYSTMRSNLKRGVLPPKDSIRTEELLNYFDYDYPLPGSGEQPFSVNVDVFESPWSSPKQLIRIGIKGYDIEPEEQPDSNLVFLLDVSGSMSAANKLPLVKQSMNLLLKRLKPTDTVAIVVYAGSSGVVLRPTQVKRKSKILSALNRLSAGGSTAGGEGLALAYAVAQENFKEDAVNRILLATDGDFNVGQSSNEQLQEMVERNRDLGIYLSVLGFGSYNYQDDMMQAIAQNGNGIAAYIDTLQEAKKVLVDEATSTLFPIANDVKIQLEFNPAKISEYRLLGYETRALAREDFNNDKVDAGEIGAGHTVTALYEITLVDSGIRSVDPLRYADLSAQDQARTPVSKELGFLKLRYKLPGEDDSRLIEQPITADKQADAESAFAAAVVGFSELLRGGKYMGSFCYSDVVDIAKKHKGIDDSGYRAEFIQLVEMAEVLTDGGCT